ncbi:(d)CMP kinase [Halocola ammonii]
MKKKINIAIDGYSSCGKSTLAKALAKALNYIYIDSGAMYRAMTLYALQNNLIKNNEVDTEGLIRALDNVYITFKYNTDTMQSETYLNAKNVEKAIRSMQVSRSVSLVSNIREVRSKLVRLQKRMAESKGVVMDGRDIGTVVLPHAEVKFFMNAAPEVRAQRRFEELKQKGVDVTFDEVMENITTRDHTDSNRSADPLRQADDAIVLDNTDLTIEEQFNFMMKQIVELVESNSTKAETTANPN